MSVSNTVDHAVVRLVVETELLAVILPNQPDTLAKVARQLAAAEINIEYAYSSSAYEKCNLMTRVSDLYKVQKTLVGD